MSRLASVPELMTWVVPLAWQPSCIRFDISRV